MLTSYSFEILRTILFPSFKFYFSDRKSEAHFVRKGITVPFTIHMESAWYKQKVGTFLLKIFLLSLPLLVISFDHCSITFTKFSPFESFLAIVPQGNN
jgi:hypothetical protein